MELIKIQFESDIGYKTVKVNPQKVMATEIWETTYSDGNTEHYLGIILEGGHVINLKLESHQNCLDMERAVWEKAESVIDIEEPQQSEMLDEHNRRAVTLSRVDVPETTGAGGGILAHRGF